MRNLKFRVWDSRDHHYCPDWFGSSKDTLNEMFDTDNKRFIFQQFTRLLDKNNKEIYEGDILKVKGYNGWFDEGYIYKMEVKFTIIESGESEIAGYTYIPKNREVIGNIFENGELLK